MHAKLRNRFDRQLEAVMARLPPRLCELLEEVPLHVEDYPSTEVMAATGTQHPEDLCGLYTGVPLTDRSVLDPARLPSVVTLYRKGILHLATDESGRISSRELAQQIRITLLHELGHFHGLTEDELAELGYE